MKPKLYILFFIYLVFTVLTLVSAQSAMKKPGMNEQTQNKTCVTSFDQPADFLPSLLFF